jgi:hypothetical protein
MSLQRHRKPVKCFAHLFHLLTSKTAKRSNQRRANMLVPKHVRMKKDEINSEDDKLVNRVMAVATKWHQIADFHIVKSTIPNMMNV